MSVVGLSLHCRLRKEISTTRHPNLTDNAIRRVTDCIVSATRHAKTCKTKVRSKWKRKINYAGYIGWTVPANGNLWTIAAVAAVAARLSAAGRCNSWAGRAGTGPYDSFARRRTACRPSPIGSTLMKAELRRNSPLCDSVGHMLSVSNARGMFSYPLNSRGIGPRKSDMHFSVILVCRFRNAAMTSRGRWHARTHECAPGGSAKNILKRLLTSNT
jgi:hypothetical protein